MAEPKITFDNVTETDVAAATWRETWLIQAAKRGGKQIPPKGDWTQCIWVAGRGFGKTRSAVEWLSWEAWRVAGITCHAVAPTLSDLRGTMMLGAAGFRSVIPPECLAGESWEQAYDSSHHELYLKNGSVIRGFGATDSGARLRGPQASAIAGDEIREWDKPKGNLEYVHTNMMLGCRLPYPDGTPARAVMATTPKAIPYLRNLYRRPDVVVVRGSTYENLPNLSASFSNTILSLEGTKIGKAEIYGEDSDAEEGGIFQRSWFRLWPAGRKLPHFDFVLQSMDTAFEEENYDAKKETADFSACVVLGVFNTKQCFSDAELRRLGVRGKYAAIVCDLWNERLGFPELLEKSRVTYRTKWGGAGHGGAGITEGRRPDVVLIENKSSGISLRQTLNTYGVPTWPFNPHSESKTMRAHAASPYVLQGCIFVPESLRPDRKGQARDWIEPLLEQLCAFAGEGSVEHDDLVDACVGPETLIVTQGGLVRADAITPGAKVLTHKGQWREVKAITARKAPAYYRLKAKGLDEIRLTGDHRVLAMTVAASQRKGKEPRGVEWRRTDEIKPRKRYQYKRNGKMVNSQSRVIHHALVLPRVKASEWNSYDLALVFPTRAREPHIDLATYMPRSAFIGWYDVHLKKARSKPIPRYLKIDYECGWVMGLFAAEGCVHRPKQRKGETAFINWTCDKDAIDRVAAWCAAELGRVLKPTRGGGAWSLSLGSATLALFFEQFGYLAPNKVVPEFVFRAPPDFVSGFIDGFVYGDGHVGGSLTTCTSTSLSLLWGVRLLLARQGKASTICVSKKARNRRVFNNNSDCRTAYALSFSSGGGAGAAVFSEDYQGLYVEKQQRVDAEIVVYDLSIHEDHSFVTTGGTMHNCVQSVLYLAARGTFMVEPLGRTKPDPDEEDEQKLRQATEIAERNKQRMSTNWYDG